MDADYIAITENRRYNALVSKQVLLNEALKKYFQQPGQIACTGYPFNVNDFVIFSSPFTITDILCNPG